MINSCYDLIGCELDFHQLDRIMESLGYAGELVWLGDDGLKEVIDEGQIAYSKDNGYTHDVICFSVIYEAGEDEIIRATYIRITDITK